MSVPDGTPIRFLTGLHPNPDAKQKYSRFQFSRNNTSSYTLYSLYSSSIDKRWCTSSEHAFYRIAIGSIIHRNLLDLRIKLVRSLRVEIPRLLSGEVFSFSSKCLKICLSFILSPNDELLKFFFWIIFDSNDFWCLELGIARKFLLLILAFFNLRRVEK